MIKRNKKIYQKSEVPYTGVSRENMELLFQEYRSSVELLTGRIRNLYDTYKLQCSSSQDPAKDPDCIETKKRLTILLRWRTELKEVATEIRQYYNPSHWRSSDYTMNMRKPIPFLWAPYTDDRD